MGKLMRGFGAQQGVTIIEMLIVVAVIGILSAIAVPNLTGFLSTSKEESVISDRGSIQSSVDGYRSANPNKIPIKVEIGDTLTASAASITSCLLSSASSLRTTPPKNNCFIDMAELANGGFLSSPTSVASASTDNVTGGIGIYSWVILSNGEVTAFEMATGLRVATLLSGTPVLPIATLIPPTPTVSLAPTLALIATISVPAPPRLMAVNSVTHRAYVAVGDGFSSSTFFVSVIDGVANTANIAVSDSSTGPIYVATNDVTNRVYFNHTGAYFSQAINGATNTVIGNITSGAYPEGIGTNPLTNRLYIANTNSSNVSVIDTTADVNSVVTTIPLGNSPVSNLYLSVLSSLNRVFVTVPVSKQVKIIDGVTNTVVQTVQLTDAPRLIAANPVTNRLYIALEGTSGKVLVMDGTDGSIITTITTGITTAGEVAVSQSLNRIYVTSSGSSVLTIIDGVTNAVVGTVTLPDTAVRVGADATNGRVYVGALTNNVWVLE